MKSCSWNRSRILVLACAEQVQKPLQQPHQGLLNTQLEHTGMQRLQQHSGCDVIINNPNIVAAAQYPVRDDVVAPPVRSWRGRARAGVNDLWKVFASLLSSMSYFVSLASSVSLSLPLFPCPFRAYFTSPLDSPTRESIDSTPSRPLTSYRPLARAASLAK